MAALAEDEALAHQVAEEIAVSGKSLDEWSVGDIEITIRRIWDAGGDLHGANLPAPVEEPERTSPDHTCTVVQFPKSKDEEVTQ